MKKLANRNIELIALLGFLAAVGPLSIDTYLPSLPTISDTLGAATGAVQLSVSAFFFGLACGQIFCGPLSDRFGRRPVIFIGFGIFVGASIACALATHVTALIIARAIQGLAASASPAAGRAVIRDVWSGNQAARAMSFVVMVMSIAPLLAPLMGGQLLGFFGWRSIFWMLVVFGFAAVVLVAWRLPETNGRERRAGTRIGAYFRAYAVVLRDPRAVAYLACGGFSSATMCAHITGVPFVYIDLFHVDAKYFGFLFGVNVIGLIVGNWINSQFVLKYGYLRLLGCGVGFMVAGALALLLCALTAAGGLVGIIVTLFIAVGPISMITANATTGLLNLYPNNAGAAAALFGVCQFGFGALAGVAVSTFYTGTPVTMAGVMVVCTLIALLAYMVLRVTLGPEEGLPIAE